MRAPRHRVRSTPHETRGRHTLLLAAGQLRSGGGSFHGRFCTGAEWVRLPSQQHEPGPVGKHRVSDVHARAQPRRPLRPQSVRPVVTGWRWIGRRSLRRTARRSALGCECELLQDTGVAASGGLGVFLRSLQRFDGQRHRSQLTNRNRRHRNGGKPRRQGHIARPGLGRVPGSLRPAGGERRDERRRFLELTDEWPWCCRLASWSSLSGVISDEGESDPCGSQRTASGGLGGRSEPGLKRLDFPRALA